MRTAGALFVRRIEETNRDTFLNQAELLLGREVRGGRNFYR